jgi:hypothetical protein
VDRLRDDDVEIAWATALEIKAEQALDAMRFGIELKWTGLQTRYPDLPEEEIDRRVLAWLRGE